jgi:hypothetical protein
MQKRFIVLVMVGILGVSAAYGIKKDSEAFTKFVADFQALQLQKSTPDAIKQMTYRFQQLDLGDQVKALIKIVVESQAPTYFTDWFTSVEMAPDIFEVLLFVTRTLDPDQDGNFPLLLEYAAQIAIDLLKGKALSGEQRLELRSTFESQLTSALANNYRSLPVGLVVAHTVIDTINGYPIPIRFPYSRVYYKHVYEKYYAMGLDIDSPEDRGVYPNLK